MNELFWRASYEGQRPGLGIEFARRIQAVFDRIGADPELYAPTLADIRRAGVARFPYYVYYRIEATRLQIISVFHTSRDPSTWKSRA